MQRCTSCSAPLRPNNPNCEYCGSRNSLDQQNSNASAEHVECGDCPDCNIPLQQQQIEQAGTRFTVAHCEQCFGMFFGKSALEFYLNKAVEQQLPEVNLELMNNVHKDRYQQRQVKYRRCPQCDGFMARRNYAYRSGVVIDSCNKHGIWLDNGELQHLVEWRQSGGQELADKNASQAKRSAPRRAKPVSQHYGSYSSTSSSYSNTGDLLDSPVLEAVGWLVKSLFR